MTEFDALRAFHFFVLSAALTYYITQSAIFAPVRRLLRRMLRLNLSAYFLYCPSCVGTWMGATLYFAGFWPGPQHWMELVLAMCTSCLINRVMPHDDTSHEVDEWVSEEVEKSLR